MGTREKSEDFPSDKEVTAKLSDADRATHINKIDQEFLDYINDIDPELSNNIGYTRSTS